MPNESSGALRKINQDKIDSITHLEMATTNQDTISNQIDKGIDGSLTKIDDSDDDDKGDDYGDDNGDDNDGDLIFSFRNPTGSDWVGSINKINLTKFKKEFSLSRSFDKIAFFGFCLGIFEFGSDAWLSYNFIHGANYTKTVHSINDTAVIDTELIKCTRTVTTATQTLFHLTNGECLH